MTPKRRRTRNCVVIDVDGMKVRGTFGRKPPTPEDLQALTELARHVREQLNLKGETLKALNVTPKDGGK